MGFGSLAGVDAHPGRAQPSLSPKPQQCPPGHSLRAALGGWAVAAGGLPLNLGCFRPPSSSSRGSREVQGGEAAWLGAQGAQIRRGDKALPAQWLLASSPQEFGQPKAPWQTGKRGKAAGVGTS